MQKGWYEHLVQLGGHKMLLAAGWRKPVLRPVQPTAGTHKGRAVGVALDAAQPVENAFRLQAQVANILRKMNEQPSLLDRLDQQERIASGFSTKLQLEQLSEAAKQTDASLIDSLITIAPHEEHGDKRCEFASMSAGVRSWKSLSCSVLAIQATVRSIGMKYLARHD